ncbi:MAG: hypothetical protein WDW36_001158 [Sanguina aurantia]
MPRPSPFEWTGLNAFVYSFIQHFSCRPLGSDVQKCEKVNAYMREYRRAKRNDTAATSTAAPGRSAMRSRCPDSAPLDPSLHHTEGGHPGMEADCSSEPDLHEEDGQGCGAQRNTHRHPSLPQRFRPYTHGSSHHPSASRPRPRSPPPTPPPPIPVSTLPAAGERHPPPRSVSRTHSLDSSLPATHHHTRAASVSSSEATDLSSYQEQPHDGCAQLESATTMHSCPAATMQQRRQQGQQQRQQQQQQHTSPPDPAALLLRTGSAALPPACSELEQPSQTSEQQQVVYLDQHRKGGTCRHTAESDHRGQGCPKAAAANASTAAPVAAAAAAAAAAAIRHPQRATSGQSHRGTLKAASDTSSSCHHATLSACSSSLTDVAQHNFDRALRRQRSLAGGASKPNDAGTQPCGGLELLAMQAEMLWLLEQGPCEQLPQEQQQPLLIIGLDTTSRSEPHHTPVMAAATNGLPASLSRPARGQQQQQQPRKRQQLAADSIPGSALPQRPDQQRQQQRAHKAMSASLASLQQQSNSGAAASGLSGQTACHSTGGGRSSTAVASGRPVVFRSALLPTASSKLKLARTNPPPLPTHPVPAPPYPQSATHASFPSKSLPLPQQQQQQQQDQQQRTSIQPEPSALLHGSAGSTSTQVSGQCGGAAGCSTDRHAVGASPVAAAAEPGCHDKVKQAQDSGALPPFQAQGSMLQVLGLLQGLDEHTCAVVVEALSSLGGMGDAMSCFAATQQAGCIPVLSS